MLSFSATCLPEWTDYNGHMNDAMYGRVFSDAIDHMMDAIGFDAAYRAETKGTLYTVEDHRWYELEVHEGAALRVETHVLDLDAKRIHIWQGLYVGEQRCAVCETMLLHISQAGETPKSAPMAESLLSTLHSHQATQELSPRSRAMEIRRR